MPKEQVEVTYLCGHTITHLSPGVADPIGIWSMQSEDTDGVIRIHDIIQKCFDCRLEEN